MWLDIAPVAPVVTTVKHSIFVVLIVGVWTCVNGENWKPICNDFASLYKCILCYYLFRVIAYT